MKNFLTAQWENLIMANYSVDPKLLAPYLPNGVELDFYNGNVYLSLVGFLFKETKIFGIPIPGLGTFEEINLRFYVIRKDGNELKRGVVFINETVPYKFVAWLANLLYKEHYSAVPTRHLWNFSDYNKHIEYRWKVNNRWNCLSVEANLGLKPINPGSFEEFIFEHYYGYTKIDRVTTEEYKINHPRWNINEILDYKIDCSFEEFYGKNFEFLNSEKPSSVMLAEGSKISVEWERKTIL